jgi:hypothetical protein
MSVLRIRHRARQCWIAVIHLLSLRKVETGEYQIPDQAKDERASGKTFLRKDLRRSLRFPHATLICHAGGSKAVTAIRHVVIPLGYWSSQS